MCVVTEVSGDERTLVCRTPRWEPAIEYRSAITQSEIIQREKDACRGSYRVFRKINHDT